ncbi:MAG TPA: hypothetical protein QF753_23260 [Victivallales bacterium]|nr:hypothetical protein [Victivallales bacterium]
MFAESGYPMVCQFQKKVMNSGGRYSLPWTCHGLILNENDLAIAPGAF